MYVQITSCVYWVQSHWIRDNLSILLSLNVFFYIFLQTIFTNKIALPTSCTSKCQPLNVSLNKPFKAILRKFWIKYVTDVVKTFLERNTDSSFKLPEPIRLHMFDWMKEGSDYLLERQEIVKSSFEVCGTSSSDPQKVRTTSFTRNTRKSLWWLENLDESEEDPFFM